MSLVHTSHPMVSFVQAQELSTSPNASTPWANPEPMVSRVLLFIAVETRANGNRQEDENQNFCVRGLGKLRRRRMFTQRNGEPS